MRFLVAGVLTVALSASAHGQVRQDIGAWLQGQPVATSLGPTDILFVYQNGVDKQIHGSLFGTSLLSSNNTWAGTNAFGTVTAPTATFGDNSTNIATTAFVQANAGGALINNAAPFSTLCNLTGITAIPTWCPAITAQAPLGIVSSVLNVNTPTTTALLMGGAGNGSVTSTTSIGIGGSALVALTSGNGNFALGNGALPGITTGTNNIGMGVNAGAGLGAGGTVTSNILIGSSVMGAATTTSQFNVAIGASALTAYTGSNTTVAGTSAGLSQTSGNQNSYFGVNAGRGIVTGGNNSIFGNCGTSLPSALSGAVMLCDGNTNVRFDWGFTTAATLTLPGPANFLGQIYSTTGTPTIASGACGTTTNGTIGAGSSNQSGFINIGAASTTTCTVSWSATLAVAPDACIFFPGNAAAAATGTTVAWAGAPSTSSVVLNGSALANTVYRYLCL